MGRDERGTPEGAPGLRVLFWGTYDLSKPRNRILRDGLRQRGVPLDECHASVWEGVRDKGVLSGWHQTRMLLKTLLAYPGLLVRFLRAPRPDVVLVGYLGLLDVLLLWPFARVRGVPVVWDQFLSLYNTVVEDRRTLSSRHLLARALYTAEWVACRAVDRLVMDTRAHAEYVRRRFHLDPEKVASVWVGVEAPSFPPSSTERRDEGPPVVLFYGQLIPLHGIETIIGAARLLRDEPIRFTIIGSGQEESRVRGLLEEDPLERLEWIPWVAYEELVRWIHQADVCLGIFGATEKAARVIPNKVFQVLAARRPLVTRDSPAIRELLGDGEPGVTLVPPADPDALAAAIQGALAEVRELPPQALAEAIGPRAVGEQARVVLTAVAKRRRPPDSSTT